MNNSIKEHIHSHPCILRDKWVNSSLYKVSITGELNKLHKTFFPIESAQFAVSRLRFSKVLYKTTRTSRLWGPSAIRLHPDHQSG